ncbi:adhesion G- coupled receptor G6-like [Paramuricea clavata]|uniref:Adhesion G- coupled receptor G6-like n=1 Tax=Paramuricea clavata TaxID=317549 RepID=A0A7D9IIG9_PARCT|nr:adhesion G- coupled receptor G6-like [Paramuricea clavata]
MVLLGLTWIFGILAINDAKLAFQYLFCIFNSLQGFVVFIMFCVLPDGTRRQLQTLIRKKTIDALRREDKHRNLEAGNASLNNLVYSSNVSPVVTSELQFRSLSSGDQVTETSFQSGDGFRIENDDLQKEISDLKFPDTMFSNPNVTRYSVRKNGSNYITTIELNLKGDF